MELILTGRNLSAQEAEQHGLISRIVQGSNDDLVQEAVKLAATIGKKGAVAVQAAKQAVNASYELSLHEGLSKERILFQALFATQDQKEGMGAFVEKRKVSGSWRAFRSKSKLADTNYSLKPGLVFCFFCLQAQFKDE